MQVAPNSNSVSQLRLQSTTKKLSKKRWAKPTGTNRRGRKQLRLSVEYAGEKRIVHQDIEWFACEICGLWVHKTCRPAHTE